LAVYAVVTFARACTRQSAARSLSAFIWGRIGILWKGLRRKQSKAVAHTRNSVVLTSARERRQGIRKTQATRLQMRVWSGPKDPLFMDFVHFAPEIRVLFDVVGELAPFQWPLKPLCAHDKCMKHQWRGVFSSTFNPIAVRPVQL
jgi:hypothetical protein